MAETGFEITETGFDIDGSVDRPQLFTIMSDLGGEADIEKEALAVRLLTRSRPWPRDGLRLPSNAEKTQAR
jgi:hypothetical protein